LFADMILAQIGEVKVHSGNLTITLSTTDSFMTTDPPASEENQTDGSMRFDETKPLSDQAEMSASGAVVIFNSPYTGEPVPIALPRRSEHYMLRAQLD
jgi:hypothetical protein